MQIEGKREDAKDIPRARIAILHAEYYRDAIERMVEACVDVLGPTGCYKPDIFSVPGCVELPLAARRIARLGKGYEAIICFGVIIKGDSYHFDIVVDTATRGLAQVMFEEDLPIIVEIIPADSMSIVEARTGRDSKNKGIEAAVTASKVIAWRREHQPK
jgi:6,7-dimethyl-8-ribityllumazine synthase